MLFEGLLKNLKRARLHGLRGEIEPRATALLRANDIVDHLGDSLNTDIRADFVETLNQLYFFFSNELLEINRLMGSAAVADDAPAIVRLNAVTSLVEQLYEAFAQAEEEIRFARNRA
jgi:flagellin-specific chaperone FliS